MIELANGEVSVSEEIGTISLSLKGSILRLHNVIYAPALEINLLSGYQLRKNGFRVVIDEDCSIQRGGKTLGALIPHNNLFLVDLINLTANAARSSLKQKPKPRSRSLQLWHRQLGHLGLHSQQLEQRACENTIEIPVAILLGRFY
jgi:hypothetical protein